MSKKTWWIIGIIVVLLIIWYGYKNWAWFGGGGMTQGQTCTTAAGTTGAWDVATKTCK